MSPACEVHDELKKIDGENALEIIRKNRNGYDISFSSDKFAKPDITVQVLLLF